MTPKSCKTDTCTALFAGSFNPFTIGHASIVERGLTLFDRIVIGIGVNAGKHDSTDTDARVAAIAALYTDEPRVEVTAYSGLTIDLARSCGARFLLRGIRSVADFEYERNIADTNRALSGIETVLLFSLPEHSYISSSMIRELQHFGADVNRFLPEKSH